jgi:neutral trehalase
VVDQVKETPHHHTLLPLPNIVFIPGDRFRETYYWDSYWIIRCATRTARACSTPLGLG